MPYQFLYKPKYPKQILNVDFEKRSMHKIIFAFVICRNTNISIYTLRYVETETNCMSGYATLRPTKSSPHFTLPSQGLSWLVFVDLT